MKNLFAAYTVVEEDIKVGDIVLERLTTGKYELFEIHTENDIDKNTQRKVRLSLCTTDVDWTKMHSRETHVPFVQEDGVPSIIQVIAPISPYAKWVKKDDTFEESDIHRATFAKSKREEGRYLIVDCHDYPVEEWDNYTPNNGFEKCVMIKGQCGYYH